MNKIYSDLLTISNDNNPSDVIIKPFFTIGLESVIGKTTAFIKQEFTIINDHSGNILNIFSNIYAYDISNTLLNTDNIGFGGTGHTGPYGLTGDTGGYRTDW